MTNKEWLLIGALGLLWGSSFLFAELLLTRLDPIVIVYLRVAMASLMMLPLLLIKYWPIKLGLGGVLALLVMGLLNNVIPFSLIVAGQVMIKFIARGLPPQAGSAMIGLN